MDTREPKKVGEIEANIKGALTSRAVAEKALEENKLSANAKPFVPSSTNKGGRSHRRKSLKKKTSKRRKHHRRS